MGWKEACWGWVVEYEALDIRLLRNDEVIIVGEWRVGVELLGRRRRHVERRQLEDTLTGSSDAISMMRLLLTGN